MIITLQDTETREISAKIDELHEERGEAALGRVLTLLISTNAAELAHDLHLERHVDDLRHVFDADRAIREQSRRYDGHCCILRARNRYFTVQRLAAVDYIFGQSQPTPHCTVPHPTWAFF